MRVEISVTLDAPKRIRNTRERTSGACDNCVSYDEIQLGLEHYVSDSASAIRHCSRRDTRSELEKNTRKKGEERTIIHTHPAPDVTKYRLDEFAIKLRL